MKLQPKRSVFRSRKSQQKTRANRSDLATTFLGERLRIKNAKKAAKEHRHGN